MKRLTTLFLVLLLAGQAWGADLHVKELAESAPNYVQYRASATGCDDAGEWTAATDLEAVAVLAGQDGTVYLCSGTYSGNELDTDGSIAVPATGMTFEGVGDTRADVVLDAAGAAASVFTVGVGDHNTTFRKLTIKNATSACILAAKNDGLTVDNCALSSDQSGANCIALNASDGVDIEDSTIKDSAFGPTVGDDAWAIGGTLAGGEGAEEGTAHDILIDNNTADQVYGFFNQTGTEANIGVPGIPPYNIKIEDNTITNTRFDAIRLGCGIRNTGASWIRRNTLTTIGDGVTTQMNAMQIHWAGAALDVSDNVITTCETAGATDGSGIILDRNWTSDTYLCDGVTVQRNTVSGCESVVGAGIFVFGAVNSTVQKNILYGNVTGIRVGCSANDGTCTGNVFYHNTTALNSGDGVFIGANDIGVTTWKNHISYGNTDCGFDDDETGGNDPAVTYGLSNSNGTAWAGFTAGEGCIETDPKFIAAASGNFRLRWASPARWAGVAIEGVTTDFAGRAYHSPPSMGAYEVGMNPALMRAVMEE